MAKDKPKSKGVRNTERPNGKAWKKKADKKPLKRIKGFKKPSNYLLAFTADGVFEIRHKG
jgi:hypothetical protein